MSIEDLSKKTTVNIQEKANLIWAIADKLGDWFVKQVVPLMIILGG